MALDEINIGVAANDGTGDDLRTSFIKTNLAIEEIGRKMDELDADNPTIPMHVSAAGTAAQMEVIDDETGHLVATMEWYKATQEFAFNLFDRTTGVLKAEFEIKPTGKAYLGGKEILVEGTATHNRASMRLNSPSNVTATDIDYVKFPLDEVVSEAGCTASAANHNITIGATGSYAVTRGIIAGFNSGEELAIMVFINNNPYSTYPLTVQGRSNSKPVSVFWTDEVPLTTGDVVDIRVKNYDTGSVTFHVKRATLQVRKL
jgi:hypothetical protein